MEREEEREEEKEEEGEKKEEAKERRVLVLVVLRKVGAPPQ